MLYYTADARDGGQAGSACNTCCCHSLKLKQGETNLVTIDYANWSLPIADGGPGIVGGADFEIVTSTTCSSESIDGHIPPNNSFYNVSTAVNAAVSGDLAINVQPIANAFTFRKMPLSGPKFGSLTMTTAGAWTYTPNSAYQGFDAFWYETRDAQGRTQVRAVSITVGSPSGSQDPRVFATQPYIDRSKIVTNQRIQTVSFAIYMPLTCRECDSFNMQLKQPAQNCNRDRFDHLSCFDITCQNC